MFMKTKFVVLLFAATAVLGEKTLIGQTLTKKFYSNDEHLDHTGARAACNAFGGILATMKDLWTYENFDNLVPKAYKDSEDHWIGAHKPADSDVAYWMDGSGDSVNADLRGDLRISEPQCIALDGHRRFASEDCTSRAASICEVRASVNIAEDSSTIMVNEVDHKELRVLNASEVLEVLNKTLNEGLRADNESLNKTLDILVTQVMMNSRFENIEKNLNILDVKMTIMTLGWQKKFDLLIEEMNQIRNLVLASLS